MSVPYMATSRKALRIQAPNAPASNANSVSAHQNDRRSTRASESIWGRVALPCARH